MAAIKHNANNSNDIFIFCSDDNGFKGMSLKESLNFYQIALHLIATFLFMVAFKTIFSLHESSMIELVRQGVRRGSVINTLNDNKVTASNIVNSSIWMNIGSTVGLTIAFFVSLFISTRNRIKWINSVAVLCIAFIVSWVIKTPYDMPHIIINSSNPLLENITLDLLFVGVISLLAGSYFFFSSRLNQVIRRKNVTK